MRNIFFKTTAVLLMTTLTGCVFMQAASLNKQIQALIGQPVAVLVSQFGMPTSRFPDGHGGEVWVYQGTSSYTTAGSAYTTGNGYLNGNGAGGIYGYGNSSTIYAPPATYSYSTIRSFFIDKSGIIYNASWKGV
jgi:hypothetical protein